MASIHSIAIADETTWDLFLSRYRKVKPSVHNNWQFIGMKSAITDYPDRLSIMEVRETLSRIII